MVNKIPRKFSIIGISIRNAESELFLHHLTLSMTNESCWCEFILLRSLTATSTENESEVSLTQGFQLASLRLSHTRIQQGRYFAISRYRRD